MNITEFTNYLISNIVKNPDMVKVSNFEGDEEVTIVEVLVSNEDMGAVIGKQGKNAKALRTVIQAYAYQNNIKKVKINIDSF
ncbi:MAG: KH domain-containing protein [Firmicutes bacterium]|nr:KH domain-containing protein [Bacillota bacterium]